MGQENDNIEKFFKDHLSEGNFEFRESDWDKMSMMLDEHEGKGALWWKTKKFLIGAISSLIVLSFLIGFYIGGSRSDDPSTIAEKEMAEAADQEGIKQLKNLQQMEKQVESDASDASFDQEASNNSVGDEAGITDNSGGNVDKSTDVSNTKSSSQPLMQPGTSTLRNQVLVTSIAGSTPEVKDNNVNASGSEQMYLLGELSSKGIAFEGWPFTQIDIAGYGTTNSQQEVILKSRRVFSTNISLAADYSGVGAKNFSGPKARIGIDLEYYFKGRFSISAGANFSQKVYTAQGSEYSPPNGFWHYGTVPDETDAKCDILDIPVMVTYYQPLKKNYLFFSTGLSSYLMLKEDYWYTYESTNPNLIDYWGTENENNHYFAVLNLAAGYEYTISRTFSGQINPYFNIPLGGVGFGRVKLFSTGIRVALKINKHSTYSGKR